MTTELTPDVSVVIPCYNEADSIPPLADAIAAAFAAMDGVSYECLLVNDGSSDDTEARTAQAHARYPGIRGLNLARNAGQSAALYLGMQRARGRFILTLDADLQNDPADFAVVLAGLEKVDCVCGYRTHRQDSPLRLLSSRVANAVRGAILRDGLRDTGCGLKGFRRECVQCLVPFNGMHRFFAVFIRNAGYSIAEVPVRHHPRRLGQSKYGVNNRLWRGLHDLVGVRWLRMRVVYPAERES